MSVSTYFEHEADFGFCVVWYLIEGAGSGSTTTLPADGSATTAVSSSVSSEPITSTAEVSILTDSPTATGTAST